MSERSTEERITELASANNGATMALTILKNTHADQIEALLATLEEQIIVGPNIWVLYNDVCEQNHARMVEVLLDRTAGALLEAA